MRWVFFALEKMFPRSDGMQIKELLDIMTRLRSKDGCLWDQEQTHSSLRPYILEEAYELVEAITSKEPARIRDEVGDVLLQVVFHATIANEEGTFTFEDVVAGLCEKLIRRHPHVFSTDSVTSVSDVLQKWETIKQKEASHKERRSLLDGIPKSLPALLRAEKVQKKAAKVGFEWDQVEGAWEKVEEELMELKQCLKDPEKAEEELGDVLFALVNVSRYLNITSECALNRATEKFMTRFAFVEEEARRLGLDLFSLPLASMDALWDQAKLKEQTP